jgi:hypothetical protein
MFGSSSPPTSSFGPEQEITESKSMIEILMNGVFVLIFDDFIKSNKLRKDLNGWYRFFHG